MTRLTRATKILLALIFVVSIFIGSAGVSWAQEEQTGFEKYYRSWTKDLNLSPTSIVKDKIGSAITTSLAAIIVGLFGYIFKGIMLLQGKVIETLSIILFSVAKYNGFVTSLAVNKGWTIVRDVANMFFVVILLAVAIGTILRVESYNFKKLLPKIILMAILVNFSRLICGLIIDAAQVVMMTFVAGFEAIQSEGLVKILHVKSIIDKSWEVIGSTDPAYGLNVITLLASGTLAVVMLFIVIGVLLAMVVFLVARMVMLWILVVLSPLAYIMAAFPQGQRYATQWWQEFIKNVIVGPVLAFFLWLAFTVASQGDNIGKETLGDLRGNEGNFIVNIIAPDQLAGLIIGIGMLLGGMMIAQQMGAAGASLAGRAFNLGAKGLPRGAAWLGKIPLKYTARKINEAIGEGRLPAWVNPMALYRGWNIRRDELHEAAKTKATAGAQEFLEGSKIFGTGIAMPRRSMLEHSEEAKFAKEFSFMNKKQMAKAAQDLVSGPNNPETRSRRRALIMAAASNGYIDDLMGEKGMQKYVRDYAHETYNDPKTSARMKQYMDDTKLLEKLDNGGWQGYDQTHLFLRKFIGQTEQGIDTIDSIETIGAQNGHPEYAGHSTFRTKEEGGHDAMEMRELYDQIYVDPSGETHVIKSAQSQALTEFNKIKGRGRIPVAPHPLMDFYDDGSIGLSGTAIQFMTSAYAGQKGRVAEHGQVRVMSKLLGGGFDEARWARNPDGSILEHNGSKVADIDFSRSSDPAASLDRTAETMAFFLQLEPDAISDGNKKIGGTADPVFRMNGEIVTVNDLKNRYPIQEILRKYQPRWSNTAVAATGTTPTPDTTTTPSEISPTAPRMRQDFDEDKHWRTREQVMAHEAAGVNFYDTDEYNKNSTNYEADYDYRRHYAALNQKELDKIRGVRTARTTEADAEQAGVGVNFNDESIRNALGVSENQDAAYFDGENKVAAINAIVDQYTKQLTDSGLSKTQARKQAAGLERGLRTAKTLRIHNNASLSSRLDQARHERAHGRTMGLSDQQLDQYWQSLDAKQQDEITRDLRSRYANLSDKQLKQEAIAEMTGVGKGIYGASNQTRNVLGGMNIAVRGEEQVEDAQNVSALASGVRAAGAKAKGAAVSVAGVAGAGAEKVKSAVGKVITNIGNLTSDTSKSIFDALEKEVNSIQDARVRQAALESVQLKRQMLSEKRNLNKIEPGETTFIKERETEKAENSLKANNLFAQARAAETDGNVKGAVDLTKQGNEYVTRNKVIDSEIGAAKSRIDNARQALAMASSAAFDAFNKLNKISGQTPLNVKAQVAAARVAIQSAQPQVREAAIGRLVESRVAPEQVIKVAEEDIDEHAEKISREATAGGNSDEMVAALNSIESTLNQTRDLLEQMKARGIGGGSGDISKAIGEIKKTRSMVGGGGVLDERSVGGLLTTISLTLKNILKENDRDK